MSKPERFDDEWHGIRYFIFSSVERCSEVVVGVICEPNQFELALPFRDFRGGVK